MDIKINKRTVVVFDLDDTLYNELDFLISAYKEITEYLDRDNNRVLFSKIFSMYRNNENVFSYLSEEYSTDKNVLLKMYRNHIPKIKIQQDVLEFLKELKKKEAKIALITDGRSITQRNKIKALEIEDFLDYISISEELGYEKPSDVPFKKVEDFFKFDTYIYIADNTKKDFISPNQLGWDSIELIDNGKNIHSNSFMYSKNNNTNRAMKSVFSLSDIKII